MARKDSSSFSLIQIHLFYVPTGIFGYFLRHFRSTETLGNAVTVPVSSPLRQLVFPKRLKNFLVYQITWRSWLPFRRSFILSRLTYAFAPLFAGFFSHAPAMVRIARILWPENPAAGIFLEFCNDFSNGAAVSRRIARNNFRTLASDASF